MFDGLRSAWHNLFPDEQIQDARDFLANQAGK
jgi:hypothetical protein